MQQVENNILVPFIMKRSVGLSPVLTILALMIGGRFGGIAGAILAVPILLTIQEIIVSGPKALWEPHKPDSVYLAEAHATAGLTLISLMPACLGSFLLGPLNA